MHLEKGVFLVCGIGSGYWCYWILRLSFIFWLFTGYNWRRVSTLMIDWISLTRVTVSYLLALVIGCSTNRIVLRMLVRGKEVCHLPRGWNFRMVWNLIFFRESRECISVDWSRLRIHVSSDIEGSVFFYDVHVIYEWVYCSFQKRRE